MAEIPRGTQYFAKANSKRSKINQKSPKRPAWRLKIAGSEVEILLISSDSQVIDSVGKKLPWLGWKRLFLQRHTLSSYSSESNDKLHSERERVQITESVKGFKILNSIAEYQRNAWKIQKLTLNNVKSFLRINSYDREIMSSWFLPEATWLSSPASRFISIRMRLAIGCCVLYGFFSASALSAAGGSLGSSG